MKEIREIFAVQAMPVKRAWRGRGVRAATTGQTPRPLQALFFPADRERRRFPGWSGIGRKRPSGGTYALFRVSVLVLGRVFPASYVHFVCGLASSIIFII